MELNIIETRVKQLCNRFFTVMHCMLYLTYDDCCVIVSQIQYYLLSNLTITAQYTTILYLYYYDCRLHTKLKELILKHNFEIVNIYSDNTVPSSSKLVLTLYCD